MSHNGHDDIATRLRREAPATAPERLRADVMLRVRAEPRPQRIRSRRGASSSPGRNPAGQPCGTGPVETGGPIAAAYPVGHPGAAG